jgi:hypothetical protein
MRFQTVIFTNETVQVTYSEESDYDPESGIAQARTLDIPHASLDAELFNDLHDSLNQIVDAAHVSMRKPARSFTVPEVGT